MRGVVVWELGVEAGGVWSTESRKEKVWETGLRFSPDSRPRLPLSSAASALGALATLLMAVAAGSLAASVPLA